MKNLFKLGFLGLALTFAVSACNSQPTETQDAEEVDVMINEDTSIVNDIDTTVIDTNDIDTNVID